ncbi:MAG: aminoglycoside phosphotransferase family protein [Bacteroidales bacterium]|nr:aminoglycoside phosphotransferase family protein [Bacteroidales bacterium]
MPESQWLKRIYERFDTEAPFLKGRTFGTGHIHDTYKIETAVGYYDYILQKLNDRVFRDIPALQDNIYRITEHIRKRLLAEGEHDPERKCLTLIKTKEGNTWLRDENNDNWRMYVFIPDHHSYDVVLNTDQAFEGGKATGRFQSMLSDLPGPALNETIPFFHDIEKRLENFHHAMEQDPEGRVKEVRDGIDFVLSRQEEMKMIKRLGREGSIPLRITHNDTKFNNILLDKNDRALCMIDLDTVMPGYIHYDFGDSIRTVANMAEEDEKDLSRIRINMDMYEAFTRGYLGQMNNVITKTELETLPSAPSLMAFIMGLRFLTDYIEGDIYYKIHKKDHNIIRSRAQFRLVESFEKHADKMRAVTFSISAGYHSS